jgi:predicted transcriptional regulator
MGLELDEMDTDEGEIPPIADLAAKIIGPYVSHHTVSTTDLPALITTVGQRLVSLGQQPAEHEVEKPKPAVLDETTGA